jgi:ankyrin repeat protein
LHSRNSHRPSDIIEVLLSIAGETAKWPDNFGWLPLHYCCACGADPYVIKKLADDYPETKTAVDRRGRTALIFAIGISGNNPDLVAVLSSTGAAAICDDNGMLVSAISTVLKLVCLSAF